MNLKDIIRMAREAGFVDLLDDHSPSGYDIRYERFAGLVAAAEREACEKACEHQPHWVACAAAIRARNNT